MVKGCGCSVDGRSGRVKYEGVDGGAVEECG